MFWYQVKISGYEGIQVLKPREFTDKFFNKENS